MERATAWRVAQAEEGSRVMAPAFEQVPLFCLTVGARGDRRARCHVMYIHVLVAAYSTQYEYCNTLQYKYCHSVTV